MKEQFYAGFDIHKKSIAICVKNQMGETIHVIAKQKCPLQLQRENVLLCEGVDALEKQSRFVAFIVGRLAAQQ